MSFPFLFSSYPLLHRIRVPVRPFSWDLASLSPWHFDELVLIPRPVNRWR